MVVLSAETDFVSDFRTINLSFTFFNISYDIPCKEKY